MQRLALLVFFALVGTAGTALADESLARCSTQSHGHGTFRSLPKIDASLQLAAHSGCSVEIPVIVEWIKAPSRKVLAHFHLSLDSSTFSSGQIDGKAIRALAKRKDVRVVSYRREPTLDGINEAS